MVCYDRRTDAIASHSPDKTAMAQATLDADLGLHTSGRPRKLADHWS